MAGEGLSGENVGVCGPSFFLAGWGFEADWEI